jgi:hypothetical protein
MIEISYWAFWAIGVVWFVVGYLCRVIQTYRIIRSWDEVPMDEQVRAVRLAGYWSSQVRDSKLGRR